MPEPISVILNSTADSGRAAKQAEELVALFRANGVEIDVRSVAGSSIADTVRSVLNAKPPMLIVGGGDGTLSTVAGSLVGTSTALGVLPLGTLNHFAKNIHVPLRLDDAVRTIIDGYITPIDVGEVNGRIFINNSSIGLYPSLVLERERHQRLGHGKLPASLWAMLTIFRRRPFVSATLRVNGVQLQRRAPFVFVGNNAYMMEGFRIGARERLDQGLLSVYVMRRGSRWALARLATRAILGRLKQARDFDAMLTQELLIDVQRSRVLVATDGEVTAMPSPLRYRTRPASLRVIVPRDASSREA